MSPTPPDAPKPSEPTTPGSAATPETTPAAPSQLTPEEQMALYEKELKETDWGHQPC
jgi:hypothetical protein